MIIIHNHILPPGDYDAINLFGILICKKGFQPDEALIRHERIHTAQMLEMGIIFFYLWYVIEWIIRLPMHGRAYTNLSFEREAYTHMFDKGYLRRRKHFAWISYIRK